MEDKIGIGEFIERVKQELLDYQEKHEGEEGWLLLDTLELTMNIGTTVEGKGGIQIYVVELGGGATVEETHSLKLTLKFEDGSKPISVGGPRARIRQARPPYRGRRRRR